MVFILRNYKSLKK